MKGELSVVVDDDPSRGAGVAPGTASVYAEIDGRRMLVAQHLFFGTQDDYTGGVDYSYSVELHALGGAWFVRVTRFEQIHYGPSSEATTVSALDPITGALRQLPDEAPEIARLGAATMVVSTPG